MTIIVSDKKPEKKIVSGEPTPAELFGSRVGLITPVRIGTPGDIGTPEPIPPPVGLIPPVCIGTPGDIRTPEPIPPPVGLIPPVKIGTPIVIRPRGGFIDPFLNNYRERFE